MNLKLLRAYRVREGYTQKGFALIIGTTKLSYGNYETGKVVPKIDMVLKIMNALELSKQEKIELLGL